MQALQGASANLVVQQRSGNPNDNSLNINIRGVSTMFQIGVVTRDKCIIGDHEYTVHEQDGRKIKHTFPPIARSRNEYEELVRELSCAAEAAKG